MTIKKKTTFDAELLKKYPNIMPLGWYLHKNLGRVEIDNSCLLMQSKNADPTSVFILCEGDMLEVTKALLERDL